MPGPSQVVDVEELKSQIIVSLRDSFLLTEDDLYTVVTGRCGLVSREDFDRITSELEEEKLIIFGCNAGSKDCWTLASKA